MAFQNGVLERVDGLAVGEVMTDSPNNVKAFDKFEDGLVIGRFAKLDAGSVDNLDGSATPFIVGVPKRKINKALETGTYNTTINGSIPRDNVANVCNFGGVVVELEADAVPTEGADVYAINVAGADAGKVTQDSGATGAVIVEGAKFSQRVADDRWIVTIPSYTI